MEFIVTVSPSSASRGIFRDSQVSAAGALVGAETIDASRVNNKNFLIFLPYQISRVKSRV